MANEEPQLYLSDAVVHTSGLGVVAGFCAVGNNNSLGILKGGMRFESLNIGNHETIDFARLVLPYSSVGSSSGSWKFKTYGINEDNTSGFGDPFGRAYTSAFENTDEGAPSSGGTKQVNVKNALQEIVNRGGWNRYNAAGFTFEDNGSSTNVFAFFNLSTSYLVYRKSAEPNFTPTPSSVSAPSFPDAGDVGMKFSKPGVSVFDATDQELHLTTRKRVPMILVEDLYESDAAETITIAHNLGYVPRVSVYAQSLVSDPWVRLPIANNYADDVLYFADDTNLYLHSSDSGQKFYYRIFVDRLVE